MSRARVTIAAARCAAGLSQTKLARAVGVAPSTVLRWERGEGAPTWKEMHVIAAALHVPVGRLVQVQADLEWDPDGAKSDGWPRAAG